MGMLRHAVGLGSRRGARTRRESGASAGGAEFGPGGARAAPPAAEFSEQARPDSSAHRDVEYLAEAGRRPGPVPQPGPDRPPPDPPDLPGRAQQLVPADPPVRPDPWVRPA